MTAVKEPADCLLGDRPVRVALPLAVVCELAQDPFLNFEPVSARSATRPGSVVSDTMLTRSDGCGDVFDVQRADRKSVV